MGLYSEIYGYTKPSDVIIRERITPEIQNAICSCYDKLHKFFMNSGSYMHVDEAYLEMEKYLWTYFLNNREGSFSDGRHYHIVATDFIENKNNSWYRKLDIVECTIKYLAEVDAIHNNWRAPVSQAFIRQLNFEFERLNFAYRVVGQEIVEMTSQSEITAIEEALANSSHNIKMHLSRALELFAQRPDGDYRNSIKESISAVEAFCREKTGENTLGKALNRMEANGIVFPQLLKVAFDKLYAYTNQPDTGIRHALMDNEGAYTPASEEALFMLVSCSAFLNYLCKKIN